MSVIFMLVFFAIWFFVFFKGVRSGFISKKVVRQTRPNRAVGAEFVEDETPTARYVRETRPDIYSQSNLPKFPTNNRKALCDALGENQSNDWLQRQLRYERQAAFANGLDLGAGHEAGRCDADEVKHRR